MSGGAKRAPSLLIIVAGVWVRMPLSGLFRLDYRCGVG